MLRFFPLTAVLSITAALSLLPESTIAQEMEGCFMRAASGRTLNLSRLCSNPSGNTAPSPSPLRGNPRPVSRAVIGPDNPVIFQAKIKRREGGTPVIDVTFNGQQQFEMIVDTGATGTVITREMAATLGVVAVKKVKFDTASTKGFEMALGRVGVMAVDGAVVHNVLVAIAGPELDIGLLGHDFFGDYDITIKRDVVEFRIR